MSELEDKLDNLHADFSEQMRLEIDLQDEIQGLSEEAAMQVSSPAAQGTSAKLSQLRKELLNLQIKKEQTSKLLDETKSELDIKMAQGQEKPVTFENAPPKQKKSSKKK